LSNFETAGETLLSELAQNLGYCDQAHFANDFRKRIGLPPAAYRRHF
jgi:AraC-like DNA-binding protein